MPSNVAAATGFAKVTGMVCAPLCPGLSESRTLPPWQGNQDRRHHCSQGGNQSCLFQCCCCPFPLLGMVGVVTNPFSTATAMVTGLWAQLPLWDRMSGIFPAGPPVPPFLTFQSTHVRCTNVWISHAS